MAAPSKTVARALLAHTQAATATVTVGTPIDVSTYFSGRVLVKLGRTVATALTNEVKFRLEASFSASDDAEWSPVYEWTSLTGKTAASSTTLNGATTAGNTTAVLTSATGFTAGDMVYFRETGTPANSEWSREKSVSSNTITLEEAQTRSHTNGITVTDLAELFSFDVNLSAIKRLRLVVDTASAASGQTVDVIAWLNTLDSVA